MDSHVLVWPLELGLWTLTLRRGPSCWGYGLPRFSVAPQVLVMDSHALVWPLELGLWTPTLWCGRGNNSRRSLRGNNSGAPAGPREWFPSALNRELYALLLWASDFVQSCFWRVADAQGHPQPLLNTLMFLVVRQWRGYGGPFSCKTKFWVRVWHCTTRPTVTVHEGNKLGSAVASWSCTSCVALTLGLAQQ